MQKTTVYLPANLVGWLREVSRQTGRSQAELLREALEIYAAQQPRLLPISIGLGGDTELNGTAVEGWLQDNWQPA